MGRRMTGAGCEVRQLGLCDYLPTWQAMRAFTDTRDADTPNELWVVEHPPVYTQGQGGKPEHLLNAADIPVVQTDRGGQVTYHGPGQLVVYILFDLKRAGFGIRELVIRLENAVIACLGLQGVQTSGRRDAPGVYVSEGVAKDAKIAALGLRVRRGCTYHGLALNVNVNLAPFSGINPCGYSGLQVTSLMALGKVCTVADISPVLVSTLQAELVELS